MQNICTGLPIRALNIIDRLKRQSSAGTHKSEQPWYNYISSATNADALYRHITRYKDGEIIDEDSKLPTLAHVALRAIFQLELALMEEGLDVEYLTTLETTSVPEILDMVDDYDGLTIYSEDK